MNEFLFGTLSTTEKRVAQLREEHEGVRHLNRLSPLAPGPEDRPTVTTTVLLPVPVERVTCTILEPERQTVELQRTEIKWDLFHWSYYQVWEGQLPAYPAGTVVRYRIEAHPEGDGEPIAADDGELFSYLVGATDPPAWSREAIIYQVFPDRFYPGHGKAWNDVSSPGDIFGGTLRGITEKLDYIADLGFNCIWLNPFFPDKTHHKYHATDYFDVDPQLGTLDDICELVEEAHKRGMRMLLDFVANHWGSKHHTFQEALQDRNSPYYDWYQWIEWPEQYKTFFGVRDLPKINVANKGARDYLLRAAEFWLTEVGFDGYRLDYSLGPTYDFWTDFRATVKGARPDAWIFGEAIQTPQRQLLYSGRLDGSLDFLLMQALRNTFAFGSMDVAAFDAFLRSHEAFFPPNFSRPSFLDNHDVNRFLWLVDGDQRRLKLAALCQFTLSGAPIVYYGTEVGLSQERDIAQPHGDIMEESRLAMLWDEEQDSELRDYYRWLVHFRREHPALRDGNRRTVHLNPAEGTYAYTRSNENETILVALNVSGERRRFEAAGQLFESGPWEGAVRVLVNHS